MTSVDIRVSNKQKNLDIERKSCFRLGYGISIQKINGIQDIQKRFQDIEIKMRSKLSVF